MLKVLISVIIVLLIIMCCVVFDNVYDTGQWHKPVVHFEVR